MDKHNINSLNSSHSHRKNKPDKDTLIYRFLEDLPHLEFSATGIGNCAKRFGISEAEFILIVARYRKESHSDGN